LSLLGSMKYFLFAVVFLTSGIGRAQDASNQTIQQIKREYNKIDAGAQHMRTVDKDLDNGSKGHMFYEGDDLRKAVFTYNAETGKETDEFYFLKGKPLFSHTLRTLKKGGAVVENRYFFDNGHIVRWINTGGATVDQSKYAAKEQEILDEIKDLH